MGPTRTVGTLRAAAAVALVSLASCAAPPAKPRPIERSVMPAVAPPVPADEPAPLLQLPPDVRPTRYALELEVTPSSDDGFRGREDVEVVLDRPRSVVWLHGRDLAVSEASVEIAGVRTPARFTQVHPTGVARLELPQPVGPGRAVIHLAWSASWSGPGAAGFRALAGGDWYAATQFEPVDARRAFPCFDEPRFKTPFDVTLVVPDGVVAVSNGPETASAAAGAGRRKVSFARTRPLPTYLVFWAVGPYDVVEAPAPPNEVRSTPLAVRVLAPKGRGAEAAFAAEAGTALLAELERYFGIPFPYPKLDHLAVPGFPMAMENAGAISYVDEALLFDPRRQSGEDRREIAIVMAHEMAHHWFGDLVTLPWWTEIWLNESFAQWMGLRAVQRWQPAWGAGVVQLRGTARALDDDALASTRAILKPLERMEDVEGQFDTMSYEKGGALLAMIERWVGEDRFREGVRSYLRARADGVGSTDELLAEISKAAGRDVAGPFRSFLDQPGAPRVDAAVSCDGSGARVELAQARSLPRGSTAAAGGIWRVPVCARYQAAGAEHERCVLLEGPAGALELPEGCPAWVMPNAGAAGYYRWSLAPPDLARLRKAGLPRLSTLERISVAQSVQAAERAGAIPYRDAMDLLAAMARDPSPEVAAAPMATFAFARDWLVSPKARPRAEAVVRALYGPAFARAGWTVRSGESIAARSFRGELAWIVAEIGRDPAVRREAARRGAVYAGVKDGKLHPEAAEPEVADTALGVAVEDLGSPAFDAILARALEARDGPTRQRLLGALSAADDPDLQGRFEEVLHDERLRLLDRIHAAVPGQWAGTFVRNDPPAVERRMALLERNLDEWISKLPPFFAVRLPFVARDACSEADAQRVIALFQARSARLPGAERNVALATEQIRLCAAQRAADAEAATRWFERGAKASKKARPGPGR
jgi:alanyl aminopeptidase